MAITLEELVVKLEADNKQFQQQMLASQQATQKATDQMSKAIVDFTNHEKEVGAFQKVWTTMVGFIGGQAVIGAFNMAKDAAKELFDIFVIEGIEASSAQIDAINRLNQALAQNGQFTEETASHFLEFASAMERTTKFQDDAILNNVALLESMTGLRKEGLEKATKAAMDLSAGMGIDLDAATRLVGKAANGNIEAFARYGIVLQKTNDDAKNFANAMEVINQRFGGRAQAEIQTFSGALQLISKGFEDIQKAIGGAITKNVAVVDVMKALGNMLFGVSDSIEDQEQQWRELIANGLVKGIEYMGYFMVTMDALDKAATLIWRTLAGTVVDSVGVIGGALNAFGVVSDETMQKIANASNSIGDVANLQNETTIFSTMAEKLAELGVVAEGGLGKVREGMEAIPEVANNANGAMQRFTDDQLQRSEEGKKLAADLIAAEWEDSATRTAIIEQRLADEIQKINDAEATKAINAATAIKARTALIAKADEEDRKRTLAKLKFETDNQMATLNMYGAFANLAIALGGNKSKELFLITRAVAVAQAVVQAQLASAQALASPPGPPYTIPLSGAVLAAGYANAAAMAATAITGLRGGMEEVPGIGSRDSFGPVALAPGEGVVDANTNADLKKAVAIILSGQASGGGGNMNIEISFKDDAINYIDAKLAEKDRLNTRVS